MEEKEKEEVSNRQQIEQGFIPNSNSFLFCDITGFIALVHSCFENINVSQRKVQIKKIFEGDKLHEQYQDSKTKRRVLSHSVTLEHKHEKDTAILLAQVNYDVIFVPQSMFKRSEKRYDILLLRDSIILKADLKSVTSKNPDTLGKRIKEGCDQASRIVLDIRSDISAKNLIEGLRSGCYKNDLLKEIMLFYKHKFHILPKNLIESKRIYDLLK